MPKTDQEIIDYVDSLHPNDLGIAKNIWNGISDLDAGKFENITLFRYLSSQLMRLKTLVDDNMTISNGDVTDPSKGSLVNKSNDHYLVGKNADSTLNDKMDTLILKQGEQYEGVIIEAEQALMDLMSSMQQIYSAEAKEGDTTRIRKEIAKR